MTDPADEPLRATWPIHRREAGHLVIGYIILVGLWIGAGEMITGPLRDSALTRTDQRVAEWMAAHRTDTWNTLTLIGSHLAETLTKIAVTSVVAVVLLGLWKRWLEPLVISVSLIIEALAFIVVTDVVRRPRPAVPHLDQSPVGTSFPSGHVAASMAYIAITVVVFWHTRNRWARAASLALSVMIPIVVALSRMYRGMHFLSDTVAGALLGGAAVLLTVSVLRHSPEAAEVLGEPQRPKQLDRQEQIQLATTVHPARVHTESASLSTARSAPASIPERVSCPS
ncbi:MAG: rane-associated phospholipid phosphatase [Ilumatobacteraceae bacterium]|nr:rane-associated phospholipid phosphatase [Ilumatobacteraceae bacterium]